MLNSWLRQLRQQLSGTKNRTQRPRRFSTLSAPLYLEALEDRTLLSNVLSAPGVTNANCMSALPDSIPLTNISLPGTYKSATGPSLNDAFFGTGSSDVAGPVNETTYVAAGLHLAAAIADGVAVAQGGQDPLLTTIANNANVAAFIADATAGVSDAISGLTVASETTDLLAVTADAVISETSGLSNIANGAGALANAGAAAADSATVHQFISYVNGMMTPNTTGNNPNNSAFQSLLTTRAQAEIATHTAAATAEAAAALADSAAVYANIVKASTEAAAAIAQVIRCPSLISFPRSSRSRVAIR